MNAPPDQRIEKTPLFNNRWVTAIFILAIFFFLDQFASHIVKFFLPDLKGYPRWGVRMVFEILVVVLAVMTLYKTHFLGAIKKMAILESVWLGFFLAFLVTLPTSLTYAISSGGQVKWDTTKVLFYTILSPFAEEILFRGFAFWMLYRLARFGFWPSALLPALVFGLAHMAQSKDMAEQLGIIALTGVGGLWFSWLLMKWENLWVPISFHILLNFWFQIFDVGVNALGDWVSIMVRAVTVILSIVLTINKGSWPFLKNLGILKSS